MMQQETLNTLALEKWRYEIETLLEKRHQDFTQAEKRIEGYITRMEELLQKSPESDEQHQAISSDFLAQNTDQIAQQITKSLEQNLLSRVQQNEDILDNMQEQLETLTRQKTRRSIFLPLSFISGTVMATLICTWMYTDHLRQYQDPVFLRYAHLGKSLIEGWSQLTQKERDKITNLTVPRKP